MNRENRKQKELEKRMSRIWQSYNAAGEEKQAGLTAHSFSFQLDDAGAGWEYVHYELDGERFGFRISYIGPDVSSFVETVTSLGKKESAGFTWYDEPGEYTWVFSRRGDVIYVEPPFREKGFFLSYDHFRAQVLEGTGKAA